MVMEVVVVSIDRPPSRWVSRDHSCGPSIPSVPPMSRDSLSGRGVRGISPADHAESEGSESVIQTGPEQAERVLCDPAVHS